jgi:hypothetical protein
VTIKKIKLIDELMRNLEEDSTAVTMVDTLKCVSYAPQLGYRNWIFKYKGMLVLLFDAGNGHYQYLCPVGLIDVFIAKILTKLQPKKEIC